METPTYSDLIGHLREDADDATWNIGYMKAVLDEPMVREKLDGSFTGYALEVANAAVKRSLALYCARAWDRARDAVSLPNLVSRLPPADELRLARKQWVDDQAFHHLVQKVESQHAAFLAEFNAATGSGALGALRVFRTEFLAHRVIHSADRRKLENTNSVGAITLHELVDWAVQTVTMVGELGFLWDGLSTGIMQAARQVWALAGRVQAMLARPLQPRCLSDDRKSWRFMGRIQHGRRRQGDPAAAVAFWWLCPGAVSAGCRWNR